MRRVMKRQRWLYVGKSSGGDDGEWISGPSTFSGLCESLMSEMELRWLREQWRGEVSEETFMSIFCVLSP